MKRRNANCVCDQFVGDCFSPQTQRPAVRCSGNYNHHQTLVKLEFPDIRVSLKAAISMYLATSRGDNSCSTLMTISIVKQCAYVAGSKTQCLPWLIFSYVYFDRKVDIQQVAVNPQEGMELAVFREPFTSPSSFEESSAVHE